MSVFVQSIEQDYSKQFDILERQFDIDIQRLYARAMYESQIEMIDGKYMTEAESQTEVNGTNENLLQKIISKVRLFIRNFLDSVSNLFKSKEHVDIDSYLASNTGQMEMEYDIRQIQSNLDNEMLKGRKLVQKISSVTGASDEEVANFCDGAARIIQKHGKTAVKIGVTFALFKAMTSKFRDKDKELADMYDKVPLIKDPQKKAQVAKVLNTIAHMIKDATTVGGMVGTALYAQRRKDAKEQAANDKAQQKQNKKDAKEAKKIKKKAEKAEKKGQDVLQL